MIKTLIQILIIIQLLLSGVYTTRIINFDRSLHLLFHHSSAGSAFLHFYDDYRFQFFINLMEETNVPVTRIIERFREGTIYIYSSYIENNDNIQIMDGKFPEHFTDQFISNIDTGLPNQVGIFRNTTPEFITKIQLCIVHQVRNSVRYVPHKDKKIVCDGLKKIYGAVNLEDAEYALEEFRETRSSKYPAILKSWDANWSELTTFFAYPMEIRRMIYTTNPLEAYHRMVRKFTKTKAILPTDDAIKKVVYLSIQEVSKKWTMPVRAWGLAYGQFSIFFEDRMAA